MQTIRLDVNNYLTKEDLFSFLEKERLDKGDTVKINTGAKTANRFSLEAIITMALLMILSVLREKNKKHKSHMTLESILDKHLDIIGLEKTIGEEYGVQVEIESLNSDNIEQSKIPEKFKISSLRGKVSKMNSAEIDRQLLKLRSEWETSI